MKKLIFAAAVVPFLFVNACADANFELGEAQAGSGEDVYSTVHLSGDSGAAEASEAGVVDTGTGTDAAADTRTAAVDTGTTVIDAWTPPVACPENAGGVCKFIFVTHAIYASGNLGGIAGADTKCHLTAMAAGLPGTAYAAWLSDSTTNARDRLTNQSFVFRLRSGTIVGTLVDPLGGQHDLLHPIDEDEFGQQLPSTAALSDGRTHAMTGTMSDGTKAVDGHCDNWTSASANKTFGLFARANQWTDAGVRMGCSSTIVSAEYTGTFGGRLYCFQK